MSPAAGPARGLAASDAQGRGGGHSTTCRSAPQLATASPWRRPSSCATSSSWVTARPPTSSTVSLSATDFIGHRFGTKGPEMCDHLLRLDDRLGAFLDSLDKVKGQVLVVLAADHGGSDFPERLAQQGYDAGRVPPTQWLKDLNAALRDQLGVDYDLLVQAGGIEVAVAVVGPDAKTRRRRRRPRPGDRRGPGHPGQAARGPRRRRLQHPVHDGSAAEAARRRTRSASPSACAAAPIPAGWATSWWPSNPTRPLASPRASYVASHGSPWNYDRRVPILFWWKGGPARERVLPIETVDIAPTIAAVTGVPVPADVDVGAACRCGAGPGC